MAALVSHHFHGWNVTVSVSQEDHSREGNRPPLLWHVSIESFAIPMMLDSFINSKQILGLSSVVDCHTRPCSFLSVVNVLRRKYFVKGILDRTSSDHFLD